MKPTSSPLLFALAAALLGSASFAVAAQTPATTPAPPPAPAPPPHNFPAPTNLKVLPKDLTGEQVHEIMEKWESELGAHCKTCHAPDPNNIGPNGRPRLNYADDSKPEKATARLMYKMLDEINVNYVAKVSGSGMPVTCGTCHRGRLGPEPYVAPEDREGPPLAGAKTPLAK